MRIMDRVLDSLGLFEEDELDELEGSKQERTSRVKKRARKISVDPVPERSLEPVRLVSSRKSRRERERSVRNVVEMEQEVAPRSRSLFSQSQVMVAAPKSFESAQEIADFMRDGRAILMNFEGTDYELARRIVDFISGVAYALGGNIKKVGQGVFLCAPQEVEVTYDVRSKFKGPDNSDWDTEDYERYLRR